MHEVVAPSSTGLAGGGLSCREMLSSERATVTTELSSSSSPSSSSYSYMSSSWSSSKSSSSSSLAPSCNEGTTEVKGVVARLASVSASVSLCQSVALSSCIMSASTDRAMAWTAWSARGTGMATLRAEVLALYAVQPVVEGSIVAGVPVGESSGCDMIVSKRQTHVMKGYAGWPDPCCISGSQASTERGARTLPVGPSGGALGV
ncbi:hypothetical protein B0T19DRAFT_20956 [Cercophora scortea]|uniref:Uncharacterized protein n=1 Tax=Cercophora scortea TaxID=314031 RepID=A0AAE0J394_9PEZI|nr:hypothetical protein B0T19DRAFT_20956 [Cercophora scortea]